MSDEELERLAAEMKNIKPSTGARKQGMDAAMAAFDAEFAADKTVQNENNVTPIQGLESGRRPIAQTEQRNGMMSKLKSIFSMEPKTAMMLGSCAAALMFAVVVFVPENPMGTKTDESFSQVAAEVGDASNEVVVQGRRITKDDIGRLEDGSLKVGDKVLTPGSDVAHAVQPAPVQEEAEGEFGEYLNSLPDAGSTEVQNRIAGVVSIEIQNEIAGVASDSAKAELYLDEQPLPENDRYAKYQDRLDDIAVVEHGYAMSPPSRDRFEAYDLNPVTSVKETPVSTFSVDVDTASYAFMRASINAGQIPQPGSIRIEEMVNYFPYDYAAPRSAAKPFKANVTVTPSPWNADTKLMHIGIKGYVPPAVDKPRSNIVLLIDTSGSMDQANKLPLLINSFKLLLNTLDEEDTVSIVTYAGSAGTVLEPTPATEKDKIHAALNRLRAGGSTAGADGLELAYIKAEENFDDEGINRIFLATDGDFNVGFSSPEDMKRFVEEKRKSGIFLSVLGFGMGNYNDALMQSLAQNGNGVAAYIDSLSEANKVLADESGSALITIAKDVKIQVEFNPATIAEYRLIGYETRALRREDFNNDKVDAGEINSGHSVTAIYELTPVGSPAVSVDDLRYAQVEEPQPTLASASEEFAFIKIRHKLPNATTSTLQTFPISTEQEVRLNRASDDTRFAAAVAAVGQKLRGDTQLSDYSYTDAIELAVSARGDDPQGYRAEFIQLVRLLDSME